MCQSSRTQSDLDTRRSYASKLCVHGMSTTYLPLILLHFRVSSRTHRRRPSSATNHAAGRGRGRGRGSFKGMDMAEVAEEEGQEEIMLDEAFLLELQRIMLGEDATA
jgi:hypothetical protein